MLNLYTWDIGNKRVLGVLLSADAFTHANEISVQLVIFGQFIPLIDQGLVQISPVRCLRSFLLLRLQQHHMIK